jgi:hypothetical protein
MNRPRSHAELDALIRRILRQDPVSRTTTIRVDGGRVSKSGLLFSREKIEYASGNAVEQIDFLSSGCCDFNHMIGSQGAEVIGRCCLCGRVVCSTAGCARTCIKGCLCCGACSFVTSEGVWCKRHVHSYVARRAAVGALRLTGKVIRYLGS